MKEILRLDLLGCVLMLAKVAEVLGADCMDEHDVPKVWVALQSKDWISAGTEIGLPLIDDVAKFQALGDYGLPLSPAGSEPVIQRMTLEEKAEIVVTPQLDLRLLRDSRDLGRRHLRFRDAVALLRQEFEDWPTSAVAPRRSFSRASVTSLATSRTTIRIGCSAAESRREVPSVTRMLSCASPSGSSLATIKST